MKRKQFVKRSMAILLSLSLGLGMVGCGESKDETPEPTATEESEPESESADEGENSEGTDLDEMETVDELNLPSAVLSTDENIIRVPKLDCEITQDLNFKVSGSEVEGEIAAEDVTLSDAFADMKVDSISNDTDSVKLTISGKPDMELKNQAAVVLGTVALAGKYFGDEDPIEKSVSLTLADKTKMPAGGSFYTFFDAMVEQDDAMEVTILLQPLSTSFVDGFGKKNIELQDDFEKAKIKSLEKADNGEYELVLSVPVKKASKEDFDAIGKIIVKKGSLIDDKGKKNAKDIGVSRHYANESLGRDLTQQDTDSIKNIVGGFGNTTMGTVIGTASGIGTAAGLTQTVLGYCGVLPTESSRHAEVMKMLKQIDLKIDNLTENVDYMVRVINKHTDMMTKMMLEDDVTALNKFEVDFNAMVTNANDVERALKVINKEEVEEYLEELEDKGTTVNNFDQGVSQLKKFSKMISQEYFGNGMTVGQLLEKLRDSFDKIMGYLNPKNTATEITNPIMRYVNYHKQVDNFSTDSMDEKELYEENIRYECRRALNLLEAVGGYYANEGSRELMEAAEKAGEDGGTGGFPDVSKDNLNKDGYPYCNIMESYVRLSTNEEEMDLYRKFYGDERQKKFIIKDKYEADDFKKRLHGQRLEDVLINAGFSHDQLWNETSFPDKNKGSFYLAGEGAWNGATNVQHEGLSFIYERWGCDWGERTAAEKNAENLGKVYFFHDMLRDSYTWGNRGDFNTYSQYSHPEYILTNTDDGHTSGLVSYGITYDGTGADYINDYIIMSKSRDDLTYGYYDGTTPIHPTHFLVKV